MPRFKWRRNSKVYEAIIARLKEVWQGELPAPECAVDTSQCSGTGSAPPFGPMVVPTHCFPAPLHRHRNSHERGDGETDCRPLAMLGRRRGGGKLSELTVHPGKIAGGGGNSSEAASDGPILEIGLRLQGHLPNFSAIQTHPSSGFHLAIDSPGLRRSGSRSQIINQAQDFPGTVPSARQPRLIGT